MAFDLSGKLYMKSETKQVSERFSKRDFVIEVQDGKYPQLISFQSTGDRCADLDDYGTGDELRITFNVRGREWKSPSGDVKYFNTLDVWKIDLVKKNAAATTPSDDNLPF